MGLPVFQESRLVNGKPGLVRGERKQVGRRLSQRELECAGIESLDPDLCEGGEFAGVVGFGVFKHEEHVGVFGSEFRREDTLDGKNEILRGKRVAVGPRGVGAQVKGVNTPVGRDVPVRGDSRSGLGGRLVDHGKTFEEGDEDVVVGVGDGDVGIEIAGLRAVSEEKRVRAQTGLDGRFALLATGCKQQCDRTDDGQKTV